MEHAQVDKNLVEMFADAAQSFSKNFEMEEGTAYWALVYTGVVVVILAIFILREKCRANADARLHPYHQQYFQHKENVEEDKAKKAIAAEIEYMSGMDFQAHAIE
mmetsp:Transcript_8643/g.14637  ORF Transcript_8643/g.14637 Transcript_8643/m.14637 type:complete len:105 (-) Transcript_8643:54-368(-)|eukprot:CAMPEP_0168609432 /NCGR_PEP_ID=MMETSP0449_2-20121227/1202_1 /TAXON_ID=1082188 /ORGANISM="Strombidium rassoulzadegani, Strain ras09" /LENGTH=104 /DNA_ID=CAMNT_0008649573 /DNA_START=20 /DNA_END=334 /DNA_ORIENTATION=-